MLDTAFAQLRLAASLTFGLPFSVRSLERLVEGLLDTRRTRTDNLAVPAG